MQPSIAREQIEDYPDQQADTDDLPDVVAHDRLVTDVPADSISSC